MMKILAVITEEVHNTALQRARALGDTEPLPAGVLNAPLDDDSEGWLQSIWATIEGAIRKAYREGLEAARPLVEQASEKLDQATEELGKRAQDLTAALLEKLNEYLVSATDGALKRVREMIQIGDRELHMKSITIEERINVSGTLKASLEGACAFLAAGELSVTAAYERQQNESV